jgi:hypothetical protein
MVFELLLLTLTRANSSQSLKLNQNWTYLNLVI